MLPTFPWLVLDIDSLCLVVAVFVLYTDEVGVGVCTEVGPQRHHVVITVGYHFHHLEWHVDT